jgi:hypothetical protein
VTTGPFDYEYWRDESRADWRSRGLHFHCHSWRGDGRDYDDEPARRDPTTDLPPTIIRDWLRKPPRTIKHVSGTPEDAVAWLRAQWAPVKSQVGQEADRVPDDVRFGMAHYDLRCGNDVCWGFWLGSSAFLHLAIVGTSASCHEHQRPGGEPGDGAPRRSM